MPRKSSNIELTQSISVALGMFYRLLAGNILSTKWFDLIILGDFRIEPGTIRSDYNDECSWLEREVLFSSQGEEVCYMRLLGSGGSSWHVTALGYRSAVFVKKFEDLQENSKSWKTGWGWCGPSGYYQLGDWDNIPLETLHELQGMND
jgi:hypothetical protein